MSRHFILSPFFLKGGGDNKGKKNNILLRFVDFWRYKVEFFISMVFIFNVLLKDYKMKSPHFKVHIVVQFVIFLTSLFLVLKRFDLRGAQYSFNKISERVRGDFRDVDRHIFYSIKFRWSLGLESKII